MNTNFDFTIGRIKKSLEKQQKSIYKNKYILLYKAIKDCIENIELPNNWLLPSTRVLAEELKLSRTTIVKSYELLQLEKLVISKVGSGFVVNYDVNEKNSDGKEKSKIDSNLYPEMSGKGNSFLDNFSLINRVPASSVAFRPGIPPLDIFPINRWKNLLNTYWRYVKSSALSYERSTGIDPLKKSISNYLNVSRNIKCDYNQIMVVSGSLQSLYLIGSVMVDKGDNIILENPAFPNVHSLFRSLQANLLPVSLDDEGISIQKMNELNHLKPKLVHVTPSNHYPLGTKMSLKRRKELLNWASINKAFIIENDYENEVANHLNKIPSIYSLDTEDRTIYMGTFNRLLHPSIRLGYMIVPKYLIKAVEALQEHSHRFVAPSVQTVMNQFIERNYLYQHLKNLMEVSQERQALFLKEFQKSKTMSIGNQSFTSLNLVAKFNHKVPEDKEAEIINKLKEANINVHSLSECFIGNKKEQGIILGYSAVRENILERKVKKLVNIIG
ncbi:MAG: PLP-dependent aminotransferase family protein [Polaribacter sp.]|uniref:MocR-like pyridoxine biosynthesis transcription factor PdxR n=1 Tax=Polaribacter sp. TaxID=1920175 RepID=UPI003BAFA923